MILQSANSDPHAFPKHSIQVYMATPASPPSHTPLYNLMLSLLLILTVGLDSSVGRAPSWSSGICRFKSCLGPNKFLWFLVISRLQNQSMHICSYWNMTIFPIHKVWWLREAAQIGQTPMWKSHLQHSTAEFQSIQQFWLQLDIVSYLPPKKNPTKIADKQVWGNVSGDQKMENSFVSFFYDNKI